MNLPTKITVKRDHANPDVVWSATLRIGQTSVSREGATADEALANLRRDVDCGESVAEILDNKLVPLKDSAWANPKKMTEGDFYRRFGVRF